MVVARLRKVSFGRTARHLAGIAVAGAVLATADPTPTSLLIGGSVCAFGEVIRLITAAYGYKIGELAVRGPYRFVRHPYFLGTAFLYFGLAIAGRQPWVMAASILLTALQFRRAVRRDEARWESLLGPRFAEYKARVPALLPRLYPTPASGDKHKFSLSYAVFSGRHREFDALIGLAVIFGLLYLCFRLPVKTPFHMAAAAAVGLYLTSRIIYDAARPQHQHGDSGSWLRRTARRTPTT